MSRLQYFSKLCYAIILSCISLTCDHATSVGDGQAFPLIPKPHMNGIPDSVEALYQRDAHRLAVRHMNESGDTSVAIPSALSESLFNSLIYIYNATGLPARDTVVSLYSIHTFAAPNLHEIILLGVDNFCEWVERLKTGLFPVGNERVDALINTYHLTVKDTFGFPGGSQFIVLRSALALNTEELAKRFQGINCLAGAEPNGTCCDGNDIRAVAEENSWMITFRLGWGDCPAGCIFSRYWDFLILTSGEVQYLGSRGTVIPSGGPRG